MTAILLMLKSFFGGLLPGGLGAVTGIFTNPLGTIKKILTLLIVLVLVATLGYFAYNKIKEHRENRAKVEAGLAATADNNAKTGEVLNKAGAIDTKVVTDNATAKEELTTNASALDTEHRKTIDGIMREEPKPDAPRVVTVKPVRKPVKHGAKPPPPVTEPIVIAVPDTETVKSKKIAAANIEHLWKSYCNAVSQSEQPCPT